MSRKKITKGLSIVVFMSLVAANLMILLSNSALAVPPVSYFTYQTDCHYRTSDNYYCCGCRVYGRAESGQIVTNTPPDVYFCSESTQEAHNYVAAWCDGSTYGG